jgi:DNA polymerase IV
MCALCRDCCELVDAAAGACGVCGSQRLVAHVELGDLAIGHIDCDAFYASVEKRDRPELRDKPLIVGHAGGRGVVTTACYIARTFGVRSAMPMFKAMDLCPDAVVLTPDMAKYKRVSSEIRAIFDAETPSVEPLSLDEAYLDLSLQHRHTDRPPAVALTRIAQRVEREIGITVSIGLSCNKFLAKLASELDKPRGFSVIGAGEAKALLAPLSIRKINGVGAATAARLESNGVMTIGQLQALSEVQLVTQYGKLGRRLAQFAHG